MIVTIRRRELLVALGGAAAAWPLRARAQQPSRLPTIGVLGTDAAAWRPWTDALVGRLRELGWIEGRTIAFEYRWFEGRPERNTEIAAEFVRLKVDVIVTNATAVPTLKQATVIIPIVFPVGPDPVGGGLVASLAQPGGNVTGLSILSVSNSYVRLSPASGCWQSSLMSTIPPACGRCARLVQRLARSAFRSTQGKSGERRTSLPPSRRSRSKPTHFTLWPMLSRPPTARASSHLRSARGCRQSSILAIGSNPGGSCPTEQTSPPSSGACGTKPQAGSCIRRPSLAHRLYPLCA